MSRFHDWSSRFRVQPVLGASMGSWPSQREAIEWLVSDFTQRIRAGEHPAIADYMTRYPEHAAQIAKLFPAVMMLERLRNQPQPTQKLV